MRPDQAAPPQSERLAAPETASAATCALPLDVRAPADARSAVSEFLNDRVPASVLETACLVVSELVTNSVRHSGVSDGVVVIGLRLTPATVRLAVADPGRAGVICPRTPDATGGGGFGLHLVQMLSEHWGLERAAAGGTRVWAQLSRLPRASSGGPPLEPAEAMP